MTFSMSDCGVEGDEVTGTQLSHLLDSTRVFLPVSLISPDLCVKSPRFRFVIVSRSMNLRGGGCKLQTVPKKPSFQRLEVNCCLFP